MKTCIKCGELILPNIGCECDERRSSSSHPEVDTTAFMTTPSDLHAFHELAQRVIKSRQNVGTPMRQAAMEVLSIIARINKTRPHGQPLTQPRE